jgi:hypothetical protein
VFRWLPDSEDAHYVAASFRVVVYNDGVRIAGQIPPDFDLESVEVFTRPTELQEDSPETVGR